MQPFGWELPYAWPRKPVLATDVVCTSQPLAAQAGLRMLADGGSAVDFAQQLGVDNVYQRGVLLRRRERQPGAGRRRDSDAAGDLLSDGRRQHEWTQRPDEPR